MLMLTAQADLAVMYRADIDRYSGTVVAKVVTLEVFENCYRGCPSIGFADGDTPIGGVLFDGAQAHIAVLSSYHGRWARLLPGALEWLFGLQKEVVVAVEADNYLCIRFMERCGWSCTSVRADGNLLYLLVSPCSVKRQASRALWETSAGARHHRLTSPNP